MSEAIREGGSRRWKQMSESEGAALVKEWRESGLAMMEFARMRRVTVSRVRYWRARAQRSHAAPARAPFFVLSAGEVRGNQAVATRTIEIVLDDRFVIRVPCGAGDLAEVVRVLKDVRS